MNTAEIKALFQAYIDEPDGTFVTNANLNSYLDAGYNEFRLRVNEYNPDFYARQVIITVNAANSYNLSSDAVPAEAVTLVGPAPSVGAANAMIRLNSVRATDAAGTQRGVIYRAVSGLRSLESNYQSWCLLGTTLTLSERLTQSFQLSYVPVADINWDAAAGFVDMLGPFHDVIALYAYKQYAIRDNALNQAWQMQMQIREADFKSYLSGPNYEANQYVNQDWYSSVY